jgi:hypothetical protein
MDVWCLSVFGVLSIALWGMWAGHRGAVVLWVYSCFIAALDIVWGQILNAFLQLADSWYGRWEEVRRGLRTWIRQEQLMGEQEEQLTPDDSEWVSTRKHTLANWLFLQRFCHANLTWEDILKDLLEFKLVT